MEEKRFFQWIAGERRGEVLILDKIEEEDGDVYLCFKDLSRINIEFVAELNSKDLSGKMMAEVESPTNIWRFEEQTSEDKPRIETDWETQIKYEIPSAEEIAHADLSGSGGIVRQEKKKRIIKLIAPKPTKNKFGIINNQSMETPKPTINTNDPVFIMMEKAKKFDTIIPMELTISLPSKSLYDVAKESFEEGGERVIDYIISNIDDKKLKANLKVALFAAYEDKKQPPLSGITEGKHPSTPTTLYSPEVIEEPIIGEPKAKNKETING